MIDINWISLGLRQVRENQYVIPQSMALCSLFLRTIISSNQNLAFNRYLNCTSNCGQNEIRAHVYPTRFYRDGK